MPGFKGYSMGPSSGQDFRRFGAKGKEYAVAAESIEAMSMRFRVIGREMAQEALIVMRDNILKYIEHGSGNFHGYSMGRLAATIWYWDPSQFSNEDMGDAAQSAAMDWAESEGVASGGEINNDEITVIEYGAYSSAKRYRGDIWAVEVGTFTPYAGLVEDGGSMPIAVFGNRNIIHIATWEANHMFKRGTFDSEADLEKIMDARVKAILR